MSMFENKTAQLGAFAAKSALAGGTPAGALAAAGYATAKLGELAMDPGNQEKQQSALAGATMPGGKEFWRAAADKASE